MSRRGQAPANHLGFAAEEITRRWDIDRDEALLVLRDADFLPKFRAYIEP